MGYALPASVGVHFADPSLNVVLVIGEGSIPIVTRSITSFLTTSFVVRVNLTAPIVFVIASNNNFWPMCRLKLLYISPNRIENHMANQTLINGGFRRPDLFHQVGNCNLVVVKYNHSMRIVSQFCIVKRQL